MRVLLDVNVLVRANEKSRGPARKLLLELVASQYVLLTSADILIELGRVLRYPRVQALFNLLEEEVYEYVQFLKNVCEIVLPVPDTNFPIRDMADISILSAAVSGDADVICTLDRDFYTAEVQVFCAVLGIAIVDDIILSQLVRAH